jgi:hypothetical protein
MGKLIVCFTRVLPFCAVLLLVLPAVASAQCTPAFAIQRVWTQGAGGPNQDLREGRCDTTQCALSACQKRSYTGDARGL